MRLGLLVGLAACTPDPDALLVVDGHEGTYALVEVALPELEDPYRMRGALGNGSVGGFVTFRNDRVEYAGGGPMAVQYALRDGVAVPLDSEGLVLWSFYNSLAEVRAELEDAEVDTSGIYPVDFAYQPTVGGSVLVTSNAAYVGGGAHHFALLADPVGTDLPLAANPLVARHELGHAVFQDIVYGGVDVYAPALLEDVRISALNEGFADILATLALDDPDVLGASFDPSIADPRRVDGDAVGSGAIPENFYERGTAYASLAWDLRELSEPGFALAVSTAALREYAALRLWEDDGSVGAVDRYANLIVLEALARDPTLATELCAARARRFPDLGAPAGC